MHLPTFGDLLAMNARVPPLRHYLLERQPGATVGFTLTFMLLLAITAAFGQSRFFCSVFSFYVACWFGGLCVGPNAARAPSWLLVVWASAVAAELGGILLTCLSFIFESITVFTIGLPLLLYGPIVATM